MRVERRWEIAASLNGPECKLEIAQLSAAQIYFERSLTHWPRTLSDPLSTARCCTNLAKCRKIQGDYLARANGAQ